MAMFNQTGLKNPIFEIRDRRGETSKGMIKKRRGLERRAKRKERIQFLQSRERMIARLRKSMDFHYFSYSLSLSFVFNLIMN